MPTRRSSRDAFHDSPLPRRKAPPLIFAVFLLCGFSAAVAIRTLDPLTVEVARDLMVPVSSVVLLASAAALPCALAQPVLGPVGDHFGKSRVLKIALWVSAASSGRRSDGKRSRHARPLAHADRRRRRRPHPSCDGDGGRSLQEGAAGRNRALRRVGHHRPDHGSGVRGHARRSHRLAWRHVAVLRHRAHCCAGRDAAAGRRAARREQGAFRISHGRRHLWPHLPQSALLGLLFDRVRHGRLHVRLPALRRARAADAEQRRGPGGRHHHRGDGGGLARVLPCPAAVPQSCSRGRR